MSDALKDAKLITEALRRSRKTLEYNLLAAGSAIDILDKDGEMIDKTVVNQKYVLKNSLEASKSKLNKIKNMQYYEKIMVRVSITSFIIIVVYIIAKRLRILQLSRHIFMSTVNTVNKDTNFEYKLDSSYCNPIVSDINTNSPLMKKDYYIDSEGDNLVPNSCSVYDVSCANSDNSKHSYFDDPMRLEVDSTCLHYENNCDA